MAEDDSIDSAFAAIARRWDRIDFLVHAIGYADKQFLRGRYLDTPRAAFLQALDISCYSFAAVTRRAVAMMPPEWVTVLSAITLSVEPSLTTRISTSRPAVFFNSASRQSPMRDAPLKVGMIIDTDLASMEHPIRRPTMEADSQ